MSAKAAPARACPSKRGQIPRPLRPLPQLWTWHLRVNGHAYTQNEHTYTRNNSPPLSDPIKQTLLEGNGNGAGQSPKNSHWVPEVGVEQSFTSSHWIPDSDNVPLPSVERAKQSQRLSFSNPQFDGPGRGAIFVSPLKNISKLLPPAASARSIAPEGQNNQGSGANDDGSTPSKDTPSKDLVKPNASPLTKLYTTVAGPSRLPRLCQLYVNIFISPRNPMLEYLVHTVHPRVLTELLPEKLWKYRNPSSAYL